MQCEEFSFFCQFFELNNTFYEIHRGCSEESVWNSFFDLKRLNGERQQELRSEFCCLRKTLDFKFVLTPQHPQYPQEFRKLRNPPYFLNYRGDLSLLEKSNVAVVGSRTPSPYFLQWMDHEFAAFLNDSQRVVVSGGAIGIDQKATRMAQFYGAGAVTVLPCGLNALYPRNLQSFIEQPQHLFITEYFPSQEMRKYFFLKRNRLIAALSNHLFVVQCSVKSGTMITAKYAIDLGLNIGTVPDFPGKVESSGNLQLIRDGCELIYDCQDLKIFTGHV